MVNNRGLNHGFGIQSPLGPQYGASGSKEVPASPISEISTSSIYEIDRRHIFGEPTSRQIEIFQLLADGSSEDEIAEILYLSRLTVHNHINRLLKKVGQTRRTGALAYLMRRGYIN